MMPEAILRTQQDVVTRFYMLRNWEQPFCSWYQAQTQFQHSNHIAIVTDATVWEIYEHRTRMGLAPLGKTIVPLILEPGEDVKSLEGLTSLVKELVERHVHRRDLLICLGGGVCCDLGGMLALLYMRGLSYINVPTSLMAQIDAAIGGKVGVNFELRKNLLGGFYHPMLVFLDPSFLSTLPVAPYVAALAEAVKVSMILEDDCLLSELERRREAILQREPEALATLVERCVRGKIDLLREDPFEVNLDRVLNLGHAVAHALERLPIMPNGRQPLHGEAVAIGLAANIRYAFHQELCSRERAMRLLQILIELQLPIQPGMIQRKQVLEQLSRIQEHRGGLFRLVVPVDPSGVKILERANPELLVECLRPSPGLG